MHFVDCGPEPKVLQEIVATDESGKPDWQPKGLKYSELVSCLEGRFSSNCAYCERRCGNRSSGQPISNEIDHFRPRKHFPDQTFVWANLLYVCRRCNKQKGSRFPGVEDGPNIDLLSWEAKQKGKEYIDPSTDDGYVNPRDPQERAESFFAFNEITGEIEANPSLDDSKWSKARRTIFDLDLNEVVISQNNICTLRKNRRLMFEAVKKKIGSKRVMDKLRDYPFSSFILWSIESTTNQ